MSNKALSHLLEGYVSNEQLAALAAIDISNIGIDSRLITTNGLFIALNGAQTDGRLYIDKAIELGAVAVLDRERDCRPVHGPSPRHLLGRSTALRVDPVLLLPLRDLHDPPAPGCAGSTQCRLRRRTGPIAHPSGS